MRREYGVLLALCVSFIVVYRFMRPSRSLVPRVQTSRTSQKSGPESLLQLTRLVPKLPNLAVPMRDHIWYRIANTSLAPLVAPLEVVGEMPEPRVFCYNPSDLSPIRDQGDCGACWAFVVSALLADRFRQVFGKSLNASPQIFLSCFDRKGCDGGSPEDALLWAEKQRVRLNGTLAYHQNARMRVEEPCAYQREDGMVPVRVVSYTADADAHPESIVWNVRNMKRALQRDGPFFAAMAVYTDFMEFSGHGVYARASDQFIGGHAVEVIGWVDAGEDGSDGYWVCRGSWVDHWPLKAGRAGYFRIVMGRNECGIESRCGGAGVQWDGSREVFDDLRSARVRVLSSVKSVRDSLA